MRAEKWPNFIVDLAEKFCHELATLPRGGTDSPNKQEPRSESVSKLPVIHLLLTG
jgi:hypothetical protein